MTTTVFLHLTFSLQYRQHELFEKLIETYDFRPISSSCRKTTLRSSQAFAFRQRNLRSMSAPCLDRYTGMTYTSNAFLRSPPAFLVFATSTTAGDSQVSMVMY